MEILEEILKKAEEKGINVVDLNCYIEECGQQFHSFEIFTFIITPLSSKYTGV
ncbi:hypothetical protein SACC_29210 [Saccharolobus caldissimus]|uniref:Uncharacterized protein n=1 Tax=Saccharolobus caldissimus TaxID=1702097 RepID=A0AAQ4CVS3_9CREN|nr:hypothetical protein SACC_29210 [Saccharolobus caldissimus]